MRGIIFALFTFTLLIGSAMADSITIYSSAAPGSVSPEMYRPTPGGQTYWYYNTIPGYAVVRSQRKIDLEKQRSSVKFSDVAAFIDPTTVTFKSLTDPAGTSVIEQNYHFDLVSLDKLAERYIGETISFEKSTGENKANEIISGKLLSAQNGQLVVQKSDGSVVSTHSTAAIFPKLPGELYTKPTLEWDVATTKPGEHMVETSYETGGMTWWTDYNIIYSEGANANDAMLDLGAWVTIVNKSGAGYPDSNLKLIAGDVQKTAGGSSGGRGDMLMGKTMEAGSPAPGFTQKAFFEYHLYTLGRKTSLPDNSTKQLELFPTASKVPARKIMVYDGTRDIYPYYSYGSGVNFDRGYGISGNKKVDVFLKFKNSEKNNMGMPLPKGRIRVNKLDAADNTMEFIGEDIIDHTPKDEDVLIRLGNAFDVVGERTQTDFKIDNERKWMSESFNITLRNHKEEAVDVVVRENLYRGANWRITNANEKYEKKDAHNVEFMVNVPKDGEKTIRYTAEYTW